MVAMAMELAHREQHPPTASGSAPDGEHGGSGVDTSHSNGSGSGTHSTITTFNDIVDAFTSPAVLDAVKLALLQRKGYG